jgi:hypothetical protein
MQKVNECALQAFEVMAVGFHVVGVYIGDDGHHRQ